MSALEVARKDFSDAAQSRALWFLAAIFVGFASLTTYAYVAFPSIITGGSEELTSLGLVFFLSGVGSLFVSLTAIVVSYKAIAGERESGSAKVLLSLPVTRGDVLLGKVVGRGATLVLPVLLGFGVAGLVAAWGVPDLSLVSYGLFVLVTALFALAYTAIVVGLSATTGSTGRASALAVGFFFVFELLWDGVTVGIVWAVNGFSLPETLPNWVFVASQLSPSTAYTTSLVAVIPDAVGRTGAAGADALWSTPWLGLVSLLAWLVVPLAVGYVRFSRADL